VLVGDECQREEAGAATSGEDYALERHAPSGVGSRGAADGGTAR